MPCADYIAIGVLAASILGAGLMVVHKNQVESLSLINYDSAGGLGFAFAAGGHSATSR